MPNSLQAQVRAASPPLWRSAKRKCAVVQTSATCISPVANSRPISAQRFDVIMQAIQEGVRRGILLVHCVGGSSRPPIMLAAWMHLCGDAEIDKALDEIAGNARHSPFRKP